MANICSIHQGYDKDCKLCNTNIRELLPDYDKKAAEAKEAGEHTCENCDFVFYLTTDHCPLCNTAVPHEDKESVVMTTWKQLKNKIAKLFSR